MSRIFGKVWYYLMLWSWGTARCSCSPSAGRRGRRVGERITPDQRDRGAAAGDAASASPSSAVDGCPFTGDARRRADPRRRRSRASSATCVPDTVAALEARRRARGRTRRALPRDVDRRLLLRVAGLRARERARARRVRRARRPPHTGHVPVTDHRVIDDPLEARRDRVPRHRDLHRGGARACPARSRSPTSSPATPASAPSSSGCAPR